MAKSPDRELNPKEERFCQEYIASGNQSEAFRKAHPKSLKWKDKTVHEHASRMMADDKVRARVAELQGKAQKKFEVTLESIINEFDEAINLAKELKTVPPIVTAITKKAELMGLFREHNKQNGISDLAEALRKSDRIRN